MIDFLFGIDRWLFFFIHQTLRNDLLNVVMPFLTDLNQMIGGKILFLAVGILLLALGGRTGRIVVVVLILTITISDQLSSSVIKPLVERERPCHVLEGVRPLVDCGSGKSFPSSHAVNMFAAAVVLSYAYKRWVWAFYSMAGIIALSRVYIGVHYPSDALGGALIGFIVGQIMILLLKYIERTIPAKFGMMPKQKQ
ncbi:MAG: phosphatase PAP2 family protein [Bacteroidota bacterium]